MAWSAGDVGPRPHELGDVGASSRAGWVAAVVLLAFLGSIVIAAATGGGPDTDDAGAVSAPATDPVGVPSGSVNTDIVPAPRQTE